MENAHPYDIFSKTMELLKSGRVFQIMRLKTKKGITERWLSFTEMKMPLLNRI